MPRYNRPNYRNGSRNAQNVHVAELDVNEQGLNQVSLEDTKDSLIEDGTFTSDYHQIETFADRNRPVPQKKEEERKVEKVPEVETQRRMNQNLMNQKMMERRKTNETILNEKIMSEERKNQELINEERARQERLREENAQQERLREENARQERMRQERLREENARQERERQERERQERERQERERQERLREENAREERARQERMRQERLKEELMEQQRMQEERMRQQMMEQQRSQEEKMGQQMMEQQKLFEEKIRLERIKQEKIREEMLQKERTNLRGKMSNLEEMHQEKLREERKNQEMLCEEKMRREIMNRDKMFEARMQEERMKQDRLRQEMQKKEELCEEKMRIEMPRPKGICEEKMHKEIMKPIDICGEKMHHGMMDKEEMCHEKMHGEMMRHPRMQNEMVDFNQRMDRNEFARKEILDVRDMDSCRPCKLKSDRCEKISPESNLDSMKPSPVINHVRVRILHAAVGFEPIFVVIGNRPMVDGLGFGKISSYDRIMDGFGTVMVYSQSSKERPICTSVIPFMAGSRVTLAVVNTVRGIQVLQISDDICGGRSSDRGTFRVANLTFDDGPFDITLSDGTLVFSDVNVKEITVLKQALPGDYDFYVSGTPVNLMNSTNDSLQNMQYTQEEVTSHFNFYQRIVPEKMYTACIIGGYNTSTPLQVLVIEN